MCHIKTRRITRNVSALLAVSSVIFWAMACNPKNGPETTNRNASPESNKTAEANSSEPFKVDDTVFASFKEFAEKLPDRCSTVGPPPEERKRIEKRLEDLEKTNPERRKIGSITIPVYFHIIMNADSTEGIVTDAVVDSQIEVLNAAFAGTPFKFVLAGTDRTANEEWFKMEYSETPSATEHAAKTALNRGDNSTLNIYTVRLATRPFGWARFPWQLADGVDGIVVRHGTLPGGSTTYFNQGDTAVHETGHWLGLYHTFENGCDAPGDEVDDTNAEASAARYCPVVRDTCTSISGSDPVENYMDFTWDSCMYKFTPGQIVRMDDNHRLYRM